MSEHPLIQEHFKEEFLNGTNKEKISLLAGFLFSCFQDFRCYYDKIDASAQTKNEALIRISSQLFHLAKDDKDRMPDEVFINVFIKAVKHHRHLGSLQRVLRWQPWYKEETAIMTLDHFWDIIAASRANISPDEQDQQVANLRQLLWNTEPEQLLAFHHHFRAMGHAAYNGQLWDVAYLINGGCSDDGFLYFRGALIAQGRERFENALRDPDSLADWCWEEFEFEEISNVAMELFKEKTGKSFFDEYKGAYPDEGCPELTGEKLSEDEVRTRFPKVSARFD